MIVETDRELYITLKGTIISKESPATSAFEVLRTAVTSSTILARIVWARIYKRFKALLWTTLLFATKSISNGHEKKERSNRIEQKEDERTNQQLD